MCFLVVLHVSSPLLFPVVVSVFLTTVPFLLTAAILPTSCRAKTSDGQREVVVTSAQPATGAIPPVPAYLTVGMTILAGFYGKERWGGLYIKLHGVVGSGLGVERGT